MRIHVTQWAFGRIEDIPLQYFQPNRTYDVPAVLGCYLVVVGAAIPETEAEMPTVTAFADRSIEPLRERSTPAVLAEAADRPPRRRRNHG
jgi:hypothetical protein